MTAQTCPDAIHDSPSAYRIGHRCAPARRRSLRRITLYRIAKQRGQPSLLIDPTGTRRRLEALLALGWTGDEIARRIGVSRQALVQMRKNAATRRSTADRVAALYTQLSDHPGPSANTARQARQHGYVPPLAWDDDTIDDPAAEPADWQRADVRVRAADRTEDIIWLRRCGVPDDQIAERIGLNPKSLAAYVARAAS